LSIKTADVYRGVHAKHPMLEAARRGIVIPGNENGSVTPEEHNYGLRLDESPYTSWSYSLEEAHRHGADWGAGYVVLKLNTGSRGERTNCAWERSPDIFGEEEVLLRGVRIDCEVIFGG
jgi:hypothetical protein